MQMHPGITFITNSPYDNLSMTVSHIVLSFPYIGWWEINGCFRVAHVFQTRLMVLGKFTLCHPSITHFPGFPNLSFGEERNGNLYIFVIICLFYKCLC